ncbi:6-phosphofructokinase 2 [Chitinophaga rupis]|uniref:6-phosphofructokinase 2 n=1 Tax=Chitinophaga rupis TaxID=573321 RepID=A0A1H7PXV8_9BACT|nr:1-phosphofructokinase family hexose kinase [Chitinophaga rupis]SEL40254.1 6-phosphofructokinase 2 [Chitinophaga rupis]
MILTVTINPAIDRTTTLPKLIRDKKLRCTEPLVEAGGGGINVSKAIKLLGGESLAVFPEGGTNGKLLQQLLAAAHIRYDAVHTAAETRENFTVTELATNAQYRFVTPGGPMSEDEIEKCLHAISNVYPVPQLIVASGSLPPGVPDNFYARIARIAKARNIKFIADTSGRPLQLALQEGVYLLKPNLTELCSLAGREYLQIDEIERVARDVIAKSNCEVLVVSMGPEGAWLITKDSSEHIAAPEIVPLSTVGAGDSMVAGIAYMLVQGAPLSDCVQFGVACGSAATMNAGTQLFKKEDVFKLYGSLKVV